MQLSPVVFSVEECAQILGISRTTLHRMHQREEAPPHLRIGTRVVYPQHLLERWLTERAQADADRALKLYAAALRTAKQKQDLEQVMSKLQHLIQPQ